MAVAIKNGRTVFRQSWAALRRNRQLLVFPMMAIVILTVLALLLLVPVSAWITRILDAGIVTQAQVWAGVGGVFLFYLVTSFIVIFLNAALIGASLKLIAGETATVGDGFKLALSHLGVIFSFALISATLGVLIRLLVRSAGKGDNIIVKIVALLIGSTVAGAWTLAVFFAIPVMVAEDLGVRAALKRGVALFQRTWGERFTGDVALGGFSCLLQILMLIVGGSLAALGSAGGTTALVVLGLLIIVIGTIVIDVLYRAVNGVFQASLYHFAVTGSAGAFLDAQLAKEAFQG